MDGLYKSESDEAKRILEEHGFSPGTVLKFVKSVSGHGATMDIDQKAPGELRDARHPCFFALRLLALAKLIGDAEPTALQVGRRWGQLAQGLRVPQISKAFRTGHLVKHRGHGGGQVKDLARTIETVLREWPDLDSAGLVIYLRSDEARDRFSSTKKRTIFVTGVDLQGDVVTYEDQQRNVQKLKLASLDQQIRRLRKKTAKG